MGQSCATNLAFIHNGAQNLITLSIIIVGINLLLVSRNYSLNNSNKALKIDVVTLFRIIDQKANRKQRTIIFTYKIFPFLFF